MTEKERIARNSYQVGRVYAVMKLTDGVQDEDVVTLAGKILMDALFIANANGYSEADRPTSEWRDGYNSVVDELRALGLDCERK